MEILIKCSLYAWITYCAVSHIRIEARKRGEDCTWKTQRIGYLITIPYYWLVTFFLLKTM